MSHIFQRPDAKLCRLMHTCSECCPRINVNDHLVAVLWLYIFPGWDYKNVVYIELMEVLLPSC